MNRDENIKKFMLFKVIEVEKQIHFFNDEIDKIGTHDELEELYKKYNCIRYLPYIPKSKKDELDRYDDVENEDEDEEKKTCIKTS